MEHIITDFILIVSGGFIGFYIYVYLEAKKDRERKRWEQWSKNNKGHNDR